MLNTVVYFLFLCRLFYISSQSFVSDGGGSRCQGPRLGLLSG